MKKRSNLFLVLVCLAPILCLACVSLMEKTGKAMDGSAFVEKELARYRTAEKDGKSAVLEIADVQNKAGERFLVITMGRYPAIKIRCTSPGAEGNFTLKSLEYLSGNTSGWNEYSMELIGSGKFAVSENNAVFSIDPEIEEVQITQGRIRRFDTRILGNDALTYLRHRRDRILSLSEWMHEQENIPIKVDRKSFEQYWKPILFPELAAKKQRPIGWEQDGDQRVKAEDIRWNSGYTERNFPEELRSIRDSGTMLRDWEEAFEWIYVEYDWAGILEMLSQETVLYNKRRN